MKSEEIKKALENCYLKLNLYYCQNECPYNKGMCEDKQLAKDVLDLINRYEVEIHKLKIDKVILKREIEVLISSIAKEFIEGVVNTHLSKEQKTQTQTMIDGVMKNLYDNK